MSEKPPSSRRCVGCGYDLCGQAEAGCIRCPECGKMAHAVAGPFLVDSASSWRWLLAPGLPLLVASTCLAVLPWICDAIHSLGWSFCIFFGGLTATLLPGAAWSNRRLSTLIQLHVSEQSGGRWWFKGGRRLAAGLFAVVAIILAIAMDSLYLSIAKAIP